MGQHVLVLYVWGISVTVQLLDRHLWNGASRRTVTMATLLLLTNGPARYKAVLHSCGTSLVGLGGVVPTCDGAHHGDLL